MAKSVGVVLIVEDDAIIRMGAAGFVTEAGFDVLEAETGDEAIEILEARADIHLVFTDITMPGTIDGIRLSHYIRDRWPPVELIVASGRPIDSEGHLPPGALFFPKPYNDRDIAAAMLGMLSWPDHHLTRPLRP